MGPRKINRLWEIGILSGMVSSIVYVLHVIIGAILWEEYTSIKQPISDLTGEGAPDAELLRVFTGIYGILASFFASSLYVVLRNHVNRTSKIGIILLVVMESTSFVGYTLFPIDNTHAGMTFQNTMHIIVTGIVVITTIGSTLLIGIGFRKIQSMKKLGLIIIVCSAIITISGASTGIVVSMNIPILGVLERINILTLQFMIFILSYCTVNRNKYINEHNLQL